MKVKMQLRSKAENRLVFGPVVEYKKELRHKETGKKLTDKQAEKLDKLLVEEIQVLIENTDFWKQNPSARLELVGDSDKKVNLNEGDIIEIVLKKVK